MKVTSHLIFLLKIMKR